MVFGIVGGAGRRKPMRVIIGLQDHAGRWHKVVFRDLRDPQFPRTYRPRPWVRITVIVASVAILLALAGWGWKHYL
jgi:hypothetical protein